MNNNWRFRFFSLSFVFFTRCCVLFSRHFAFDNKTHVNRRSETQCEMHGCRLKRNLLIRFGIPLFIAHAKKNFLIPPELVKIYNTQQKINFNWLNRILTVSIAILSENSFLQLKFKWSISNFWIVFIVSFFSFFFAIFLGWLISMFVV